MNKKSTGISPSVVKFYKPKYPQKCGMRCYYQDLKGDEEFYLHNHNYVELEFVKSGSLSHELCGVRSEISAGDLFALSPLDFHSIKATKPTVLRSLAIMPKMLPSTVQQLLGTIPLPLTGHIPSERQEEVDGWFSRLRRLLFTDEPHCEEKITAYLMLLLSAVAEYSTPLADSKQTSGYKHVTEAIEYMQEHYVENITLDDVARAVYLSPNHLSKLFSKVNGIPVSQYLTRLRIEAARGALAHTDKSVTEIAMECGFGSFSSFSRSWKRLQGINPREYRLLQKG